ncbi:MAG: deoxynucleoside kinase [Chitinophagales bacterium]|nr:deoxynucleoside kinase [Chitinophagales bacterium]MDW8274460.1 deoxynucleoside kinase [Chitinophagales bacterium]
MQTLYRYVAVEGAIGSGKTTLASLLSKEIPNSYLLLEKFDDNPFLSRFYQDPKRYAFSTELFFTAERYRQLKELTPRLNNLFSDNCILSDFIFHKSLVFAGVNLEGDEWKLFRTLYEIMLPTLPKPDIILYLYASVDFLIQRIKKRGRTYERNIAPQYLDKIQQAYMNFFRQMPECRILLIDAERRDFSENEGDVEWLENVLNTPYEPGIHSFI